MYSLWVLGMNIYLGNVGLSQHARYHQQPDVWQCERVLTSRPPTTHPHPHAPSLSSYTPLCVCVRVCESAYLCVFVFVCVCICVCMCVYVCIMCVYLLVQS